MIKKDKKMVASKHVFLGTNKNQTKALRNGQIWTNQDLLIINNLLLHTHTAYLKIEEGKRDGESLLVGLWRYKADWRMGYIVFLVYQL